MSKPQPFSRAERLGLWVFAALGMVGINGAFACGVLTNPDAMRQAMTNPIAAAFMIEALALVALLAYLLVRWKLTRMHWGVFVGLSMLGSLAFALPVALLWGRRPPDSTDSGES
ncbi:MAG: hypothetical protein R3236_01675 [Phycisphaeraceae bacterium]|nr:hypothetical protein [Phycisphaeraceae bacterium]